MEKQCVFFEAETQFLIMW